MTCRRRRLFDCLLLGGQELDLLALHLNATANEITSWIVIEATTTLNGSPRVPHGVALTGLKELYGNRLVHVVANNLPCRHGSTSRCDPTTGNGAFQNEAFQRSLCSRELQNHLRPEPDDAVLVLDPDEIPSPAQLRALRRLGSCTRRPSLPMSWDITPLPMHYFAYDLGCFLGDGAGGGGLKVAVTWRYIWNATRTLARRSAIGRESYWAQAVREVRVHTRSRGRTHAHFGSLPPARIGPGAVEDMGYHLSTFMSPTHASMKLRSFAHVEIALRGGGHVTHVDFVRARIIAGCHLMPLPGLLARAPKACSKGSRAHTPADSWIQRFVAFHLPDVSARGLARNSSTGIVDAKGVHDLDSGAQAFAWSKPADAGEEQHGKGNLVPWAPLHTWIQQARAQFKAFIRHMLRRQSTQHIVAWPAPPIGGEPCVDFERGTKQLYEQVYQDLS